MKRYFWAPLFSSGQLSTKEAIKRHYETLLYVELAISIAGLAVTLAYLPDQPATPPSRLEKVFIENVCRVYKRLAFSPEGKFHET